jgi:hypothetical protein
MRRCQSGKTNGLVFMDPFSALLVKAGALAFLSAKDICGGLLDGQGKI